jgi:hypothetical protein
LVTGEKFGSQLQTPSVVHSKHVDGGASRGRNPNDAHTPKQEGLSPPFAPGVEEGNKLAAQGIHARKIWALAKITAVTCQREVVDVISPAVLFSDDMLDMMR